MSQLEELYEERLRAWAGSVQRLIDAAPIRAVVEEVGLPEGGHSTPPEREVIRKAAHAVIDRWLARDLAYVGISAVGSAVLETPAASEPES